MQTSTTTQERPTDTTVRRVILAAALANLVKEVVVPLLAMIV